MLEKLLKIYENYSFSCLSAKNNPIKSRAVHPRPKRPLNTLVSALHISRNKAPKISPKI